MVRAFIVVAALAGCGQPSPLTCIDNSPCLGGACIDGFCAEPDLACNSGFRYGDSAGDHAGDCTTSGGGGGGGSGSGSGDGGTGSADDVITLPLDGTAITIPAASARDDIAPGCGSTGGVDVMFQATVTKPGVLYVDTTGTSFEAVLGFYVGTCAEAKTLAAADECISTGAGSCGATLKQFAGLVAPGTYCLVIDQATSNPTHATAGIRAKLGPPAGLAQPGNNVGSTCADDGWAQNCGGTNGTDLSWFLMACGGTFHFDEVAPTAWDGDLQAFGITTQLACDPGNGALTVTLTQPGPIWFVAHELDFAVCEPNLTLSITRQ